MFTRAARGSVGGLNSLSELIRLTEWRRWQIISGDQSVLADLLRDGHAKELCAM